MIDSHCHLDFDVYDGRREKVIADAAEAGVQMLVNIGVDLPSSRHSVELAEKYDNIYATVGVHPHDAKTLTKGVLAELKELAQQPKVVAIGEIGLDFYRNLSPADVQKEAFRTQIELAIELSLPIVIHTRNSFRETLDILMDYLPLLKGGVFHCFPGTVEDAEKVISLGFHLSVGGVVTFKKAKMAQVAAEVPLERLLLETDSPYLTPVPFRGKENQPAYVAYVYKKVAELRGMPLSELEKNVDRTVQKFFGLAETFGG